MSEQPAREDAKLTRFAYFMIRVHNVTDAGPRSVSGLVERLGTGEKRSFQDGEELLGLLSSWSTRTYQK